LSVSAPMSSTLIAVPTHTIEDQQFVATLVPWLEGSRRF